MFKIFMHMQYYILSHVYLYIIKCITEYRITFFNIRKVSYMYSIIPYILFN